MEDEDEKIQIAAVRVLKVLTQAVTPESACYRLACDAAKDRSEDDHTPLPAVPDLYKSAP